MYVYLESKNTGALDSIFEGNHPLPKLPQKQMILKKQINANFNDIRLKLNMGE